MDFGQARVIAFKPQTTDFYGLKAIANAKLMSKNGVITAYMIDESQIFVRTDALRLLPVPNRATMALS